MTNDEAKALYDRAQVLFGENECALALDILDRLDQERPNSRHVNYQRALCLAELGRKDEAEQCAQRLDGKLDAGAMGRLHDAINKVYLPRAGTPVPTPPPDEPAANVLTVQEVYPASTDQCTIMARIRSGVFHVNDELVIIAPANRRIAAPILRIGTAETPIKLVRAGQTVSMLIQVDPDQVVVGASLSATAHEEAYAATMAVDRDAHPKTAATREMTQELTAIDKMMKRGEYGDAERLLNVHLLQHPGHYSAHRLLAQLYLDAPAPLGNAKIAAEQIGKAYEKGGAKDLSVIHVLAEARGRNGDPEQGLAFLERLDAPGTEPEARSALAQWVHDYRSRFNLGHVWQFADTYGEVIYEASNHDDALRAFTKGAVPRDARCRRDRVGDWQPVDAMLAYESPEIAKFLGIELGQRPSKTLFVLIIALVLAILFTIFAPMLLR
jgi:hypothetical protein